MSEECNHDCGSCGDSGCSSRQGVTKDLPNSGSKIGKVIAVLSGKGGVGKSTVTARLAAALRSSGKKVGILDADITGPSIPGIYGIHENATADEDCVYPVSSAAGVKVMSINLLLEEATEPVIWRGPILSGTVRQFWTDVAWGELDVLLVDMPPGTGDVPLTVFQSLPVDGIVVVTSPQELVSMIVGKAVRMAGMMEIPILGIVENLSYYICPDCGKRQEIFGHSNLEEIAAQYRIPVTLRLPMDPKVAALCDEGKADSIDTEGLSELTDAIVSP